MRSARTPERVVQQQVVHLLRSVGGKVYILGTRRRKGDFMGTMQTSGLPDLCAFLPIRAPLLERWQFLWIEVKSEGGTLRAEQHEFRAYCMASQIDHVVGGVSEVGEYLLRGGWVKEIAHYRKPSPEEAGR